MNLSKRLHQIYELVPTGSRLADIGTDHGLLIIKCLEENVCTFAYGLDIAKQPLDAARTNLVRFGFEERCELVLGNGLEPFKGEANCFVAAGMGAETIWGIIALYPFKETDTIILQSNTKNPWLRKQVTHHGFNIIDERFLIDKGMPVTILVIQKNGNSHDLTETEAVIGPVLIKNINDDYRNYLTERMQHLATIHHHDVSLRQEFDIISEIVRKEC